MLRGAYEFDDIFGEQIMDNSFKRWSKTVAAALLLGVGLWSSSSMAGISSTKHNLGTTGTGTNHLTAGTSEICVFCHTPHASNTASGAPPLWNKALPTSTYTTYSTANSSTIDGEVLSVGSVSLACLSCHDGTQAMDNMINAPGSGGYNASGASLTGATWTGANQTAGVLKANIVTNIGTDLRNDHPVGIQYCGGGITTAGGTCADSDFYAPANATINGTKVWWVDTSAGTTNTREKTDMILYTRTFTAGVGPSVECASCHDPHSTNTTFLRIENTNSAVCLSCHNK